MNIFFDNCKNAVEYTSKTKAFSVFYSKENNPNLNMHTHECCEILLCVKGGKNFLIDDKIYNVHDGDIFILNQFEAHKITFEPDCKVERYVVEIHPDYIFSASSKLTDLSQCFYKRTKNTSNCLSLSENELSYLISLFKKLENSYEYGDDIIKNAVMSEMLAFVNRLFINNHSEIDRNTANIQLRNAIIYINEHLSEELTLSKIAKNSYISVNQLCKIFKQNLGTTVNKYIVSKRISYAKRCLNSGMNVSDTAFECGFCDYSNFIRTFTSTVGISPGKYKKKSE